MRDIFLGEHEIRKPTDNHGRHGYDPDTSSFDPKVPVVSQQLKQKGLYTTPWKGNAPYALCFSHDVDNLHVYSRRIFRSYASSLLRQRSWRGLIKLLFARYDLCPFKKIIALEASYGAASTFYVMATTDDDSRYKISSWKKLVHGIMSSGAEVALHGGYDSYQSADILSEEKKELESVSGVPIAGVRQHFLRFQHPNTWQAQAAADFTYDSTFGFANAPGFRNGMAHPFYAIGTTKSLVVIPLVLMDTTFSSYQKKNMGKDIENLWLQCKDIIDATRDVGGAVSILWHADRFNDQIYPGSSALYKRLLAYGKKTGAWMPTTGELVQYMKEQDVLPSNDEIMSHLS